MVILKLNATNPIELFGCDAGLNRFLLHLQYMVSTGELLGNNRQSRQNLGFNV